MTISALVTKSPFAPFLSSEMESLLKEEDPDVFRREASSFLKDNGRFVDYALTVPVDSLNVTGLVAKINKTLKEDDYFVSGVTPGLFNRSIPNLKIAKNPDNPGFSTVTEKAAGVSVKSREEADYLADTLSQMEIPWDSTSACEARAEAGCQILASMNIPKKTIKKVWIQATDKAFSVRNREGESYFWQLHVAPMVEMNSKEKRVIDPFFSKKISLSLEVWVSQMVKEGQQYNLIEIDGRNTYDFSSGREVPITEEMSRNYRKTLIVHNYASLVPEDSTLQFMFLTMLPPRINQSLGSDSSQLPKKSEKESTVCTVS